MDEIPSEHLERIKAKLKHFSRWSTFVKGTLECETHFYWDYLVKVDNQVSKERLIRVRLWKNLILSEAQVIA